MASWLVCLSPDRAVQVRALAGDIVLCSWARHLSLTVPLSTQVYKWVPANLMLGLTLRWTGIPSRGPGSRNTPSRFMPWKPELSAGLMDPRGPNADFTFTLHALGKYAFEILQSYSKLHTGQTK